MSSRSGAGAGEFATTKAGTNPECWFEGNNVRPFDNLDDSGRWIGTAPGDTSGDTQWWLGRYSQVNPLSTLMANKGDGLPPSMADPLFTAVDPTIDPAKQTAVGGVMPYFALDYLPFTSIPIANGSERPSTGSCSTNGS